MTNSGYTKTKKIKRFIIKNPLATVGFIICILFIGMSVFAPFIATHDPIKQNLSIRNQPPSIQAFFGTDKFGRDVFSRNIYAARVSLPAGLIVIAISAIFGGLYGAVAGYFGKYVDEVMMRFADMVMSFPSLILAMALTTALGASMMNAVLAIVVVWWPKYARMMRGLVLNVRETEYVLSAKTIGENNLIILLRTVIPNCVAPLLVMASVDLGNAILIFSGLGFLGLGMAPPTPEWGSMVSDGVGILQYWWVSFFPGLSIFLISVGINFIGDAVRDIMDPRLKNNI
jgi:peptide/nickel transport system permease protein